jgi:hypothetical protein
MSDSNESKVDRKLIEEEKKFVITVEKMTTLKRQEVIALTKIYDLGGFFGKHGDRIIEKQLGALIAEIVLSILRLKKCRSEYVEKVNKSNKDNPRLAIALRNWIVNDEPKAVDSSYNKTYPQPEPPEGIEPHEGGLVEMEVKND